MNVGTLRVLFRARMRSLVNTQQSIESGSSFVLSQDFMDGYVLRAITEEWEHEFREASAETRLNLLYLANDIVQRGKALHATKFADAFRKPLEVSFWMLRGSDGKAKAKAGNVLAVEK